jgi:hypothetical protein
MPRKKKKPATSSGPSISIGGNVGGSVTVGDHNIEVGSVGPGANVVIGGESAQQIFDARQQARLSRVATPEEIASLAHAFHSLDQRIAEAAPNEKKAEAQAQAEALKEAVAAEKPDVTAMAQAKAWFVESLPALLGAVTSVLSHPLVGRLVEAAGQFTVDRFRSRLGLPDVR